MTDLPAGPELDRLVAEMVMGWAKATDIRGDQKYPCWEVVTFHKHNLSILCVYQSYPEDFNSFNYHWSPSKNIAHAWEVLERLKADHSVYLQFRSDRPQNGWGAMVGEGIADAETVMVAICNAALKATPIPGGG